jgi:hypothetical protein
MAFTAGQDPSPVAQHDQPARQLSNAAPVNGSSNREIVVAVRNLARPAPSPSGLNSSIEYLPSSFIGYESGGLVGLGL